MKSFNESEIKYLAGLLDADGSLSFKFAKYKESCKLHLSLSLDASLAIDKHGYLRSLAERAGGLYIAKRDLSEHLQQKWIVGKASELNQLLPRIIKHMVIKGKHWNWLYNTYLENIKQNISLEKEKALKEQSALSRASSGPLKPKKHPTWAWVSGYLDGDGHYSKRYDKNPQKTTLMRITLTSHEDDYFGVNLLQKAFGGTINHSKHHSWLIWHRNLGVTDHSFALAFLRKMHAHSRLKKHKIEEMLQFHNIHLQRLTEKISTESVIV